MTLDRLKTELQETGRTYVGNLSLRRINEIVSDLGLEPTEVTMEAWRPYLAVLPIPGYKGDESG